MNNEQNQLDPGNLPAMLSDNQVAELLGINRVTIWRWVERGVFPPPIKIGGTRNRRPRAQILEYMRDPEAWKREARA